MGQRIVPNGGSRDGIKTCVLLASLQGKQAD
jgi:hypothetical protein